MPLYDYRCLKCNHVWEVLVSSAQNAPGVCPQCNSKEIVRLFPAAYIAKSSRSPGRTCCGREERCDTPPCSTGTCRMGG
ncbi:MAG TPA: zinc ribbon domain-containing protein [Desulfotomaculum sp.]|nr:zinc ribbon domain-containing protein [Desulfotomaculum sp.]